MNEETSLDLSQHRTNLSNIRSHLSNERTHLSYLRTGIALISFGVTLNRFSLFLIQNDKVSSFKNRPFLVDTKNVGIGMVTLGSALLIWSIYHFTKTAKEIRTQEVDPSKWSVVIFTSIVAVLGTFTTLWMILS